MMYKDDIEKEIAQLETEIRILQKWHNYNKLESYEDLIKLRKRQQETLKGLLPKAKGKPLASQCVEFNDWRYEPSVCK